QSHKYLHFTPTLSCHFFFSSRIRHTSSKRDCTSYVCSSDLISTSTPLTVSCDGPEAYSARPASSPPSSVQSLNTAAWRPDFAKRSEERRVGREGRGQGWTQE